MDAQQARDHLIEPVCQYLGLHSMSAVELLLGTCAAESDMGRYVVQIGGGPARGVMQMERATEVDIWQNWLSTRPMIAALVENLVPPRYAEEGGVPLPGALIASVEYSFAMARILYRRIKAPLPEPGDWKGHAMYWKRHYNTPGGAGTETKFLAACYRHLGIGL